MFKKLFNYLPMLAMASAVVLSGCGDDDQPAPAVTQENEVPNGTAVVTYSVQVLGSSQNNAKVTGLSGATVTVSGPGGNATAVTDESGIAVFPGMRLGTVSVFVKSEGYLSSNFNDDVDCYYCSFDQVDSEQQESDQTTVTLPKIGATLKGTIYGNFDFNGTTTDAPISPNATVIATVSSVLQPNTWTTTTDNTGAFQFTNLPEGVAVTLSLDFQNTNTTATPTFEYDWSLGTDDDGPYILSVNNVTSLGIIDAQ